MKKEHKQNVLLIIITMVIAVGMVWLNTWQRCREQFREGEAFYEHNDYLKAITAYETAIHAYTPFNSMIPKAAERLWDIGMMYEQKGEFDAALIALRSLRSSFYAVRSLYTPYPEWIEKTEKRIPEIIEKQENARKIAGEKTSSEIIAPPPSLE